MPDITPKLSLKQPLGNETVNREAYNENLRLIDHNAAAQVQVDEPFYLKAAAYNETFHRLELTLGPGRAAFLSNMVSMSSDSVFMIDAPSPNTSYYLFIHSDGSFSYQFIGNECFGGVLIWEVTTGDNVREIVTGDMRGRLCGAAARIVQDNLSNHINAFEPHPLADPLGVPKPYFFSTLPPRHLWCNGKTIGDSLSGATARADADVQSLYLGLWNSLNNTQLPVYNSDGTVGVRGNSALTDFNAHKRLALPDMRGRTIIGTDNMGNISANRVTATQADMIGGTGGEENHRLTIAEMPIHNHTATYGTNGNGSYFGAGAGGYTCTTMNSAGGDQPHNNMPPYIALNWIIRY
jgi:hypothetical protein